MKKMKKKLLCILHRSPPKHGAAKVGDFIFSSKKLRQSYECYFITIKSSETIGESGKINFKKLYRVIELYFKVLWALTLFRPEKIYYTASIRSVAFYRDLLISTLWKTYGFFKPIDIYYHYHTKGIDEFVSTSKQNLILTRFFIKNTNLILLSPILEQDFNKVKTYKKVYFLPNGVEDSLMNIKFDEFIYRKFQKIDQINVLYLSNMIKSKGYFEVLQLAKKYTYKNIHFHFAGAWQSENNEKEFFSYIKENELSNITFHGFVNGKEKNELFKKSHIFIFPTRYKNEAFPLSILEALSYGIPIVATDEGSIPCILDEKSGLIFDKMENLNKCFEKAINKFINIDTAKYCRQRYLKNFTFQKFENNFIEIFQK